MVDAEFPHGPRLAHRGRRAPAPAPGGDPRQAPVGVGDDGVPADLSAAGAGAQARALVDPVFRLVHVERRLGAGEPQRRSAGPYADDESRQRRNPERPPDPEPAPGEIAGADIPDTPPLQPKKRGWRWGALFLSAISGLPPSLTRIPPGCPFHPRCPMAEDRCTDELPPLAVLPSGRSSACLFAEELVAR